jgi:hypothetical protein
MVKKKGGESGSIYQMPTHQFAIFNIPSYKSETDAGRGGGREKTHPSHLPVTYEITGWENYDKRFFFDSRRDFASQKKKKVATYRSVKKARP